jgi:integrase
MAKSTARQTRRRSAGEGSVYEVEGRWRGAVTWTEPDGRRRRRVVSGATSSEARDKLDALRRELRLGTLAPAGPTLTVGEYLAGWIERHRAHVRPSTWRTAESYVRVYLVPALGRHALVRLSSADVERALAAFVSDGRPGHPGNPVAPITAAHVRATLRTALAAAQRDGLVGRNAAADARPPQVPHRAVTYLDARNVRRLLAATADESLGPLYAIAATTGLRRGELLGLRWTDVVDGTLTVRRAMARDAAGGWSTAEPKSARSRRSIPLPGTARATLDRQKARQNIERLAAGSAWQDRYGLVFTDAVGRPLLPEFVSHAFAKSRKRARVPAVRFHDLRHSAATMMLAEGIPLAVISEWLGHAGIAITAAHYAAVVPELRRDAADAMDRALRGES